VLTRAGADDACAAVAVCPSGVGFSGTKSIITKNPYVILNTTRNAEINCERDTVMVAITSCGLYAALITTIYNKY
jgi:hypothetical protein